jgi:hypothetical protein
MNRGIVIVLALLAGICFSYRGFLGIDLHSASEASAPS